MGRKPVAGISSRLSCEILSQRSTGPGKPNSLTSLAARSNGSGRGNGREVHEARIELARPARVMRR